MRRSTCAPFLLTLLTGAGFILLTILAMLLYAGGTLSDPSNPGYAFFGNFFSDLGITQSHSGAANTASAVLFFVALTGAGIGLLAFFIAFRRHFGKRSPWLSGAGTIFGIISGLSFVGVAFSPADLLAGPHVLFVQVAFLALLFAVLPYTVAVVREPSFPSWHALILAPFAILLVGYIYLLFAGPSLAGESGLLIHVVGQKAIVYAAIITVSIEAYAAYHHCLRPARPT
jgi:hypothetical membrane protein